MNPAKPEQQTLQCLRCGSPMKTVRIEEWSGANILIKQLQKIADSAGLKVLHCTQCGKVEFYK